MNSNDKTSAIPAAPGASQPSSNATGAPPQRTPLQPPEAEDESVLASIGKAITAPIRDAAEDEDRKQQGQPRKP